MGLDCLTNLYIQNMQVQGSALKLMSNIVLAAEFCCPIRLQNRQGLQHYFLLFEVKPESLLHASSDLVSSDHLLPPNFCCFAGTK